MPIPLSQSAMKSRPVPKVKGRTKRRRSGGVILMASGCALVPNGFPQCSVLLTQGPTTGPEVTVRNPKHHLFLSGALSTHPFPASYNTGPKKGFD